MLDIFRWRRRRREGWRAEPFPAAWREILQRNVRLYSRLSPQLQGELEGHVQVLLKEKRFEGCGGLALTDEIRVTIAGHASVLLLGRPAHYYPGLHSVLVYPSTFRVPRKERLPGGVVAEGDVANLGESWTRGVVVVAWDAVLANVHDFQRGHNVTLHEFAHQLDTEDGVADGVPLLETRSAYASWARALRPEFERLQAGTHEGALDRYGAEHPAEFFAVATEAYFEKPLELRRLHPELYAELARFYRIDPTSGSQTRARDGP